MNFHVDEHIIVEDNSTQVNKQDAGDVTQDVPFRCFSSVLAVVTEVV